MIKTLCLVFWGLIFAFLCLVGLYLFCIKIVFEMDRDKNTFVKKTKYFWQKQYKEKLICNLSDISTAYRSSTLLGINKLYLKLKSSEKVILFRCFDLGIYGKSNTELIPLIKPKEEINNFLRHEDGKNIEIKLPLGEAACWTILASLMAMCFFLMVLMHMPD